MAVGWFCAIGSIIGVPVVVGCVAGGASVCFGASVVAGEIAVFVVCEQIANPPINWPSLTVVKSMFGRLPVVALLPELVVT